MNNKNLQSNIYSRDEELYKHLYQIPPKKGRYIVLDTETTGLQKEDHIVELGACEILNGNLTGSQFHIYIRPRIKMERKIIDIHGITNKFYDEYYKDVYQNDKQNLLNFSKWVGNSIIFAHNAPFDMNTVNKELYYWGLHEIPIKKYRCSMRIFREIISKNEPLYDEKYTSLEKCCEYFGLKVNDKIFHNALFDSYMTARVVCKIYEKIDSNPILYKDFDYNNQKSLESHYFSYIRHKVENYNKNNFYFNHDSTDKYHSAFSSSLNNKNEKKLNKEINSNKNIDKENLINEKKDKKINENINEKNKQLKCDNIKERNNNKKIIKNNEEQNKIDLPPEIINELFKEL